MSLQFPDIAHLLSTYLTANVSMQVLQDASYPFAEERASDSELQACEQLKSTEAELQAQFLTDMAAMREEVEAAEKKLSAANAAVDAVSQVEPIHIGHIQSAWPSSA